MKRQAEEFDDQRSGKNLDSQRCCGTTGEGQSARLGEHSRYICVTPLVIQRCLERGHSEGTDREHYEANDQRWPEGFHGDRRISLAVTIHSRPLASEGTEFISPSRKALRCSTVLEVDRLGRTINCAKRTKAGPRRQLHCIRYRWYFEMQCTTFS